MSSVPCDNSLSAPSLKPLSQAEQATAKDRGTYGQILKSSVLVGGSTAFSTLLRIARTKALAVLLGPAGFGLYGLYGSISDLAKSLAEMGINTSGVRQIAAAAGSGDTFQIGITTAVLRRTALVLGTIGAALLLIFSKQVSTLTFGNNQHASAICLLSLAVFFQLISEGQGALIQGMRRIFDLAKMGVLGAFYGTVISIVLVYFLREKGLVPSLVGVAGMSIITSWWYSRKILVETPPVTLAQIGQEAAALLKLGFAFMATIFMTMGNAYAVRIMVLHKVGFAATGYYQSAWALGGLYVGFVLQAMGADFYPRLTASANDNPECNRLVNEQARVGLLLAGPGVLATLVFAPMVIELFYSTKFDAAVAVLRWICLGTILQVITWPLGYVIIAKGRRGIYFTTQVAWSIASLGLAYLCVRYWSLNGAGIAFFGSNLLFGVMEYPVVQWLSGFRWSSSNMQLGLGFLSLIAVVFSGFYLLPPFWAACLGAMATISSGFYSVRVLSTFVSWDDVPLPVRRLFLLFRPSQSR
jgi:PST family polysaccharide transporter